MIFNTSRFGSKIVNGDPCVSQTTSLKRPFRVRGPSRSLGRRRFDTETHFNGKDRSDSRHNSRIPLIKTVFKLDSYLLLLEIGGGLCVGSSAAAMLEALYWE